MGRSGLTKWIGAMFLGGMASVVSAQDLAVPTGQIVSPILTVDQEILLARSEYGVAKLSEIEEATEALAEENRQIEADLVAREAALTDLRPTIPADQFRTLAAEFDAEVRQIRTTQDEKQRDLLRRRETLQKSFFAEALPVLAQIARERGAVAVMDKGVFLIAADQIDVTAELISRLDQRYVVPDPNPQTETAPD
jgi:Skp family chaperone for outer membrane proteins